MNGLVVGSAPTGHWFFIETDFAIVPLAIALKPKAVLMGLATLIVNPHEDSRIDRGVGLKMNYRCLLGDLNF